MTQMRRAVLRRRAATVGALVALGVVAVASLAIAAKPAPAPSGPERGTTQCKRADDPAADSTTRHLRGAIRCLINEERAIRGFGELTRNEALQTASQRHVKAMVASGCLAHHCPDEPDLETRLDQAGYFDGVESWRFAENTGCGISAEAMVENWLASDYHRINILDKEFAEIGVGATKRRTKVSRCKKQYGTFTFVAGVRTR